MFGVWVSPCCLEPILLKQGVGDDELMLRTELQKQAAERLQCNLEEREVSWN